MARKLTINDDFIDERRRNEFGYHDPHTLIEHTLASLDTQTLARVASTYRGAGEDAGTSSDQFWLFPASSTRPHEDEDENVVYNEAGPALLQQPLAAESVAAPTLPPGGSAATEDRRPGISGRVGPEAAEAEDDRG